MAADRAGRAAIVARSVTTAAGGVTTTAVAVDVLTHTRRTFAAYGRCRLRRGVVTAAAATGALFVVATAVVDVGSRTGPPLHACKRRPVPRLLRRGSDGLAGSSTLAVAAATAAAAAALSKSSRGQPPEGVLHDRKQGELLASREALDQQKGRLLRWSNVNAS